MKKLITMFLALLVGMTSFANPTEKHFYIEGKFLSQKNVHYDVYRFKPDGTLKLVKACTRKAGYSVKLTQGNYVIKFTAPDNKVVKCLYLDITRPGLFEIDVDFTNDNSAHLEYDGDEPQITCANSKELISFK